MHRLMTTLWVLAALTGIGCAGPAKLAERSEGKLAEGDVWKAWNLATRALDKAPANERAREAAASAAAVIAEDWQRRITSLAAVDSMAAAEQVLEFVGFRTGAIRYTTVHVSDAWTRDELLLRQSAARVHYAEGAEAMKTKRPKKAYSCFLEAERFLPNFRDAAKRADAALDEALTRVAVVPLRSNRGDVQLGRDIAAAWSGSLVEHMPAGNYFTRILPVDDVERELRVSDLGHTSRDDAIRLGRLAGADRVVWGSIGEIDSKSSIHFFAETVWRRVVEKDETGAKVSRWVEVPIQVVSRVRTVDVDLAYEVISTQGGVTLARDSGKRTMKARAVWTAYVPEDGPDSYALVTDEFRTASPERAKQIESKWESVVGAGTTLSQVLDAKRASAKQSGDRAGAIARFAAGAAFVMLEDLPTAEELTYAALAGGWQSVHQALVQLDGVDDVDLGAASASRTSD
jgi:hypothetical protein